MALTDARGVAHTTDNRPAFERFERAVALLLGYYLDPLRRSTRRSPRTRISSWRTASAPA